MSDRILIETAESDTPSPERRRPWWTAVSVTVLASAIVGWSFATSGPDITEPDPTLVPEPFSPPEGTWSEVEFTGEGAFTSVLDSGEGLIAAGSGRRVDSIPFVWVSGDGAAWERAQGPWVAGDHVAAIVKAPSGHLAAGYRIDRPFRGNLADAEPRIWASPDGRSWESGSVEGLPVGGVITDMVATADGLIAIGWAGPATLEPLSAPIAEADPRVWSTEDGITWSDVTPDGAATWFADVAAGPSGVAVGGADERGASVWTLDRGAWAHLPAPEASDAAVTALTWRNENIVALTRSAADPEALVFAWSVSGNGTWAPTVAGNARPATGGWIATIGGDLFAASAFTRSVISDGPEVFVSQTGREWIGVEITAGLTPWPPPRIMAVLEFRGELFAFGSRGTNPAAWRLIEEADRASE